MRVPLPVERLLEKPGATARAAVRLNGRCELDDKECLWARAYERLKSYGESETMLDRPVTIYNATLKDTSSWANLYLDRDHDAPREK